MECGGDRGLGEHQTSLSNALRQVEVKDHQPGEGELAELWSTGISPRWVGRVCKQAGCLHRASLAGLGKSKGGYSAERGTVRMEAGEKFRNVPGSGKC